MTIRGRLGATAIHGSRQDWHGSRQDWLAVALLLLLAAGLITPAWALDADPIAAGVSPRIAVSATGLTTAATAGNHLPADGPRTRLQRAIAADEAADTLPDLGRLRLDTSFVGEGFGAGLALGEQQMLQPSLIADETERRGLSGRIALDVLEAEITAFSVNPLPIVSTETARSASEPTLKLNGFDVAFAPLPAQAPTVRVRMGFNRGEASWTADGAAAPSSESGSASVLGFEASLFGDRLTVLAEASRTEFDSDGEDGALAPLRSDGYRVTFEATPYGSEDPAGMAVHVTGAYERLGTFFRTLTNPGLAGDADAMRLGTSLVWPRFSVDAVASHLTNNVDDLPTRPRDRWIDGHLGLTYRPDVAAEADGALPWYGQAKLFTTVSATDVDRLAEADTGPTDTANSRAYAVEAGVSLDPGWGSFGLSQGYRAVTARSAAVSETDSYVTTASLATSLSPRLSVRSDVRYEFYAVSEDGLDQSTVNLTIGTDAALIPGRLNLNLDYLAELQYADAVAPDTQSVSADLFLKLLRARGGRPGIGVSLNGIIDMTRGHFDPATGLHAGPETRASIFARLKLWTNFRDAQ